MTQHLMISDGVHRYLPVYCYFLISSILIEFPCNLQINTYYQGSNLFMSICTASHRPKDLLVFLFSCSSFSPELFFTYFLKHSRYLWEIKINTEFIHCFFFFRKNTFCFMEGVVVKGFIAKKYKTSPSIQIKFLGISFEEIMTSLLQYLSKIGNFFCDNYDNLFFLIRWTICPSSFSEY